MWPRTAGAPLAIHDVDDAYDAADFVFAWKL
jgi:hypothetical protein